MERSIGLRRSLTGSSHHNLHFSFQSRQERVFVTFANAWHGNMTRMCAEVSNCNCSHPRLETPLVGQGKHELRENFVSFENQDFFQTRTQARSRAMTPSVPLYEIHVLMVSIQPIIFPLSWISLGIVMSLSKG